MDSIGGYRIIRRLGSGSRADVYLGHAGRRPDGTPELAAVKVFKDGTPDEAIDAEITALSRLGHPHIVRLLDLATGPRNTPSLILQRLEPSGLARLLADRRSLEAGEAVTILAPLVAAVSELHRLGVTHGRIGPAAVLFDATGAPVLSGFGASTVITPGDGQPITPAQLDANAGVSTDLDALTALVRSVLARVVDPAVRAGDFSAWVAEQRRVPGYPAQLARGLFAFSDAVPVNFSPDATQAVVPHRFDVGRAVSPVVDAPERTGAAEWTARQAERLPEWLVDRLAGTVDAIRRVRRRVWLVAGSGLLAVVVAITLAQVPEAAPRAGNADATVDALTVPVQPVAPSVAAGDDPVAAAVALLERREQCLRERSILCLDTVHQADSAAWHADATRIQGVEDGGELDEDVFAGSGVSIIDRMGDTVLLAVDPGLGEPSGNATASVLMIRTEAGWRIRSLLEGAAPFVG
ncbi:protein kinase domain-containing protein [Homoserinimonas sp. A447]